jgi:hypothetical protein
MAFEFFRRSNESRTAREARERAAQRAAAHRDPDREQAARRAPLRPQDLTLTEIARRWLETLPADERPSMLAAQYPRIANRLALCWNDPVLVGKVLDDLLVDRRGGRRGFPGVVRQELMRLRSMGARQRAVARIEGLDVDEVDNVPWSLRTLAIGDRHRDTLSGGLGDD